MEELETLRTHIVEQRYTAALELIDEIEEMSRKAILDAIQSFLERLLLHLIKNDIEQRLTNSWAASLRDSLLQIRKRNLRDSRSTSWYIRRDEWADRLDEAYEVAIADASVEVMDGMFTPFDLHDKADREQVLARAKQLLDLLYNHAHKDLPMIINEHLSHLPGGREWRGR
jgi:hypothetical protein